MHLTPAKRPKLVTALIETFGFSPWLASIVALFIVLLAGLAVVWLWLSAPPRTVTLLTGPPGTSFDRYAHYVEGANREAKTYDTLLAQRGIKLEVVSTEGSADNLKRLRASSANNLAGFVQGGLVGENPPPELVSLGSVAYQPLWVFYRGSTRISLLSELSGKRIGIGGKGTASNGLARTLLQFNGIQGQPTTLVEEDSEGGATALLGGKLDAIFLMGEAASIQTLRTLMTNSSGAVGSLQAQQSGNELLALQVKQSLQAQALIATQARADALRAVEQQASGEAARERFTSFIGDGRAYAGAR